MVYRILADLIVIIHFLWILFLIFGALPGVRIRAVRYLHVSGLIFAVVSQLFGWYCPLTHLEVWLRARQAPGAAYAGSFLAHYAEKLVYLELPPATVLLLTVFLGILNGWLYVRKGNDTA